MVSQVLPVQVGQGAQLGRDQVLLLSGDDGEKPDRPLPLQPHWRVLRARPEVSVPQKR